MKSIFTLLALSLFVSVCIAQKKITILGSSTAAGNGATVSDSAWVYRLQASFRKNTSDGVDTIIDNRAVPGYYTYNGLPTGYSLPANRTSYAPDPLRNVTYILNDAVKPDIVILSYPSNDVFLSSYDPKETMDNLRLMVQQLSAAGITCYVSSSQPRNDAVDAQRLILKQLVDSANVNFGNYAINFWDDLVTTDGQNRLKAEVNSGDGIHPNNLGHRLLFQQVQAKNIFSFTTPLPLILKEWNARLENNVVKLAWNTSTEEDNTLFEIQRSANSKDFQTIYYRNGTGHDANYSWTDASPLNGKSFYRLKINEQTRTIYSRTVPIINDKKQFITSMYVDASQLHLQLYSVNNQLAVVNIIDYSGAILKKQSFDLRSTNTSISIPVSELRSGEYFIRITTSGGINVIDRFSIMK